ncbi:hypothetical protein [Neptuniibacter sp. QD37_11]|uniref:hypothetical protein n=1 Tax=Neptuniibacter sp. QD37_11 TaxID=3398209 RepID=UPI0039F52BE1
MSSTETDYATYKKTVELLEENLQRASEALKAFPRGNMGLVPDDVKSTDEFKAAKLDYDKAHNALRNYNQDVPKTFKRQRSQERREAMAHKAVDDPSMDR